MWIDGLLWFTLSTLWKDGPYQFGRNKKTCETVKNRLFGTTKLIRQKLFGALPEMMPAIEWRQQWRQLIT